MDSSLTSRNGVTEGKIELQNSRNPVSDWKLMWRNLPNV